MESRPHPRLPNWFKSIYIYVIWRPSEKVGSTNCRFIRLGSMRFSGQNFNVVILNFDAHFISVILNFDAQVFVTLYFCPPNPTDRPSWINRQLVKPTLSNDYQITYIQIDSNWFRKWGCGINSVYRPILSLLLSTPFFLYWVNGTN